ncbi:unnamed protein product [marine sediment metagenome]|uniref:Uncharacterized protein n=1 Tax=marine sediment metagenome TaxID=412755 RepID=X1LSJ7_9ZZZZ
MLKIRVKKGKEKIRSILLPLSASVTPVKYRIDRCKITPILVSIALKYRNYYLKF